LYYKHKPDLPAKLSPVKKAAPTSPVANFDAGKQVTAEQSPRDILREFMQRRSEYLDVESKTVNPEFYELLRQLRNIALTRDEQANLYVIAQRFIDGQGWSMDVWQAVDILEHLVEKYYFRVASYDLARIYFDLAETYWYGTGEIKADPFRAVEYYSKSGIRGLPCLYAQAAGKVTADRVSQQFIEPFANIMRPKLKLKRD
jgi:TPR repeat protein